MRKKTNPKILMLSAIATLVIGNSKAQTGTPNYIAKFGPVGTSLTTQNSQLYDNATNIGIGTTAPSAKLHVVGSFRLTRLFQNSLNIGISSNGFANPTLGYGTINFLADQNNTADMAFSANGTSHQLVIKNSGKVGVGVTDPQEGLDVLNNIRVGGIPATGSKNFVLTADANGSFSKIAFPTGSNRVNQVLRGDGTFGTDPTVFHYTEGRGIRLETIDNVFYIHAKDHFGDALSDATIPEKLKVVGLQTYPLSANAPTNGQVLSYDGTSWIPTTISTGTTYTAGPGLNLSGNTFSLKAHIGDATSTDLNPEKLTVVALQNRAISNTAPINGQVLGYNGTSWIPTTISTGNTYTAGAGLNLSGNAFSLKPHTGDAVSNQNTPEVITVVALQNRPVSNATPINGQVLTFNGSSWVPQAAVSTVYTASNGLTKTLTNDIQLGGTLSSDTEIKLNTSNLALTGTPTSGKVTFAMNNSNTIDGIVNIQSDKFNIPGLVIKANNNGFSAATITNVNGAGNLAGTGLTVSGGLGARISGLGQALIASVTGGTTGNNATAIDASVSGDYVYAVGVNSNVGSTNMNANVTGGYFSGTTSGSTGGEYSTGVVGSAQGGRQANYGGYFRANVNAGGSSINYGIYATAAYGPTNYAGYFDGNVAIQGNLFPTTDGQYNCGTSSNRWNTVYSKFGVAQSSDENLKTNIKTLGYGLKEVMKMNPVSFEWKANKGSGPKLGFLAQDLEKIIKEVVIKNGNDDYAVYYSDIIPVLVNSIKEQQAIIESQNTEITAIKKDLKALKGSVSTGINSDLSTTILSTVQLLQNNPNPFSETTSISYVIPETAGNAYITIYDMQGTQLRKVDISQKGKGSITINGSELVAGMYLYSLIVDGKEIDTKRMILTK